MISARRPEASAGPVPQLPPGFTFGTATAALQVEGAADLRGQSIWDTFCAQPGRIADGTTGETGADHYHRMSEDVALMARLGAGGYRFSISWPRVLPAGRGAVDPAGLDFYDRLVDALLEHGIEPVATLYHWDLPQVLQEQGGWLERGTVDAFAEYAGVVGARLADRVAHWVPVNEPNVAAMLGHGLGIHAPGLRHFLASLAVGHHLLLAHGRATTELRRHGAASVGCANNHAPIWPATDDPADVGAGKLFDALWNGLYLEPMLLGRHPADVAPLLEGLVEPGDMATIRQPLDFYGVTYFGPMRIAAAARDAEVPFDRLPVLGHPTTDVGWPVVPDALREWLVVFRARYRAALPPLVVTGSGCAFEDDRARVDYHAGHLRAVQEAIARGVDVRGYYCSSLLDGFWWEEGHRPRFGLVHVDDATGERTPKRSFQWYADVIAAQPRHA